MRREYDIWVVDDNGAVLATVSEMLTGAGFFVSAFERPEEALSELSTRRPDIFICDIKMPGMDGVTLLENVRKVDKDIPVILMTAYPEIDAAIKAIGQGVFDLMIKPIRKGHVLFVVNRAVEFCNLLVERREYPARLEREVRQRTQELQQALEETKQVALEAIHVLMRAAEHWDDITAAHIKRIGIFASMLAKEMGYDDEFCEELLYASPMHDVGKIGIPDALVFKPVSLNSNELEVMKRHAEIGAKTFKGCRSKVLKLAGEIAFCHHERFDGSGYPRGLMGKDIPFAARIVMIVDQYDALRSDRPYRKGYSHEDAVRIITEGDGRTMPFHFDGKVLEAFSKVSEEFDTIFNRFPDI